MATKILNFGSLNIDYVYALDHIVKEGETEASVGYYVFEGGKGLNQSVALARAGANVYHAGKIGREGLFLKEAMENSGVDCRFVSVSDGANGHAIIQRAASGQNSIILYPGANHQITAADIDNVLENFCAGDILVCQNEISQMEYLIEAAYKKGMKIAWNPSPITDVVDRVDFGMITWLIINEIEGQAITGQTQPEEILKVFKAKYPGLRVVLTLGGDGSVYQDENLTLTQQRYTVPVKDTTAAGDTFLGYFVKEVASDDADISVALQLASMAAALAVSKEGAMPSVPVRQDVEAALAQL
jgi:ribokinase